MKFNPLMFALASLGLAMSSCNLDKNSDDNYQIMQFNVCNLITPASGTPFATAGNYYLKYFTADGNMTVETPNLSLGTGNNQFTTSKMTYGYYPFYDPATNGYYEVTKFQGGTANTGSLEINNLKGYTSQGVYLPLSGDPVIAPYPTSFSAALVLKYDVNQSYTVRTFLRDEIFTGSTTIRTGSTGSSFDYDGIRYRVFIKDDLQHADVIFYSAKFAQAMPRTINFVLQNLEIKYNRNGYSIQNPEGQVIVPQLYEGGGLTPYEPYQFTSFLLNTTDDDLTQVAINYTVAGMGDKFYCTFAGSYVRPIDVSNSKP